MSKGRCFVIQPFDQGKYDKRYVDLFAPAIVDANLEPYRVDADPLASIPIDEIARQIRSAKACFAEISTDNPNVWFELGYALSAGREICMVCSDERTGKFPFDVQHRQIITYNTNSISDFHDLRSKITIRLFAVSNKLDALSTLEQEEFLKPTSGL